MPHARPPHRLPVTALLVCGLLLGASARDLLAQSDASRVEEGDSVRLRLPGALTVDASVGEVRNDVITLRVVGLAQGWPVSVFDMASLEVLDERTPREGLRYGFGMGFVAGVFAGAAVGLALHSAGVTDDLDGPASLIMGNTLRWAGFGAVAGGIGGAIVGSARPGVGWIRIELPGH